MKKIFLFLALIPHLASAQNVDVSIEKRISKVSFGSCSKQDQTDNQLWEEVNGQNPDLWIWLGDNIYGDTEDMKVMKEKYDLQKSHPDYQNLLSKTEVIGIWDDHDYGVNDGGKEFPAKDGSKVALFDFLDVSLDHPAQNRKAAYQSYSYVNDGKAITVILLDTRYYRDSLKWENPDTRQKKSMVNQTGDVLGQVQWDWLKNQLQDESTDLFILASGIQLIPFKHPWEKWANFPTAQTRLYELIASSVKAPLVVLSGDRHLSEVSRMSLNGYDFPLYEFTSSSLNAPSSITNEENDFRINEIIYEVNFATMTITWKNELPSILLEYTGKENKPLMRHVIDYGL